MTVRPAKIQISLGIRPVWSEFFLCARWVAKDQRFLHGDSEASDQTGRMPRLIWVFAGRTLILLVLSCRGSIYLKSSNLHKFTVQPQEFRYFTPLQVSHWQAYLWHLTTKYNRMVNITSFLPALCNSTWYLSLITRKPVFRVFNQVRLKPACAATGAS